MYVNYQWLGVTNGLVCLFIFWVCICRLTHTHRNVLKRVRFKYTVLLGASLASAFQPILFAEYPSLGSTILAFAVAAELVCGTWRWKRGAPKDTLTGPAPLSEH